MGYIRRARRSWTPEQLADHIEGQPANPEPAGAVYLDDPDAMQFRILGYTEEYIYFFTKAREIVQSFKNTQVASGKGRAHEPYAN